ncbi:hypothetical protein GCK32_013978 [Trichostrongylus colubriformis]|uniref:SWIM-type domain-containing protein n=1 Tax=Trichostrongylus colubriformis TaxID=6319 RepID=A0AAN8EX37_TRICO
METLSCLLCGNAMTSFNNYLRHLRRNHGDCGSDVAVQLVKEKKEKKERGKEASGGLKFDCPLCDYKGPSKNAVLKHKARNHREPFALLSNSSIDVKTRCHCVVCPQCSTTTNDFKSLISHAREKHSFNGEIWKEEREMRTITSWSCYSCITNGDIRTKYYKCNRSRRKKGTDASKRRGHSKTDRFACTSFLKTVENKASGTIDVEYCDVHIGHLVSAALLPLSDADKKEICSLLKKRFSVPSVTRAIRMEHTVPSERLYWITTTDVRNTLSSMGLERGKYSDNDLESIATRFFKNDPEDGLRSFSPPSSPDGTGFCLIVITPLQVSLLKKYGNIGISLDDTHNACRYNLKLLTLMVVDNIGRGLPAAYMLSANMDKQAVNKFFEIVSELCPDLSPKYFMTDNCNTFWNSFLDVFPEAAKGTKRLLCSWHVQCAVFDEFNTMFPGRTSTNTEIHATLLSLFTVPNKPEWHRCLPHLYMRLRDLQCGEGNYGQAAKEFEEHFSNNYVSRKELWAPYARLSSIMNTNMFNERFHRLLKYSYLNRMSNVRMDALLQALLDIVSDTVRNHEIMDTRNLMEGKFRQKENLRRHRKAVEHETDYLFTRRTMSTWMIKSNSGITYTVRTASCPCKTSSGHHCLLCDVCPFAVFCSCPDNIKAGTSCKHIICSRFCMTNVKPHLVPLFMITMITSFKTRHC